MRSQRNGKDNAKMKYCRLNWLLVEHVRQDQSYITLNYKNKCSHQRQRSVPKYKLCSVNLRRSGEMCA